LIDLYSQTDFPLIQLIASPEFVQNDTGKKYSTLITNEGLEQIATYAYGIGPCKPLIQPVSNESLILPTTNLITMAHSKKLAVHVWTFRNERKFLTTQYKTPLDEYTQFFELGADGVFTDFPDIAFTAKVQFLYNIANVKTPTPIGVTIVWISIGIVIIIILLFNCFNCFAEFSKKLKVKLGLKGRL